MHDLDSGSTAVLFLRVVRFGAAGLMATLCYLVLSNALVWGGNLSPLSSSVVAYLISVVVSYLLQSRFTFGLRRDSVRQLTRFTVTSVIGLFLCWLITYLAADVFHWPYFAGSLLICILIPTVNYFLFQGWVFATGLSTLQGKPKHEK